MSEYRRLTISICGAFLVGVVFWILVGFLFNTDPDPTPPDTSLDTVTDAQAVTSAVSWVHTGPDWENLVSMIKHEEGFRTYAYQDTRGFRTIGFGTKFPLLDSDWHCFNRVNLDAIVRNGVTYSQADCLLRSRLSDHYLELLKRWVPFSGEQSPVQMALLDMVYQLGVDGLLGFHKMLAALARHDYPTAIQEAIDSAWDHETPSRVDRVVSVFRSQENAKFDTGNTSYIEWSGEF